MNYIGSKINSLDPLSRVTETTTTFDGDGSTRAFDLADNLRYISTVTVNSVAKTYGTNWSMVTDPDDADYGKIVFTVADTPAVGTDNVSVTYGYGKGWVYPDFPRNDIAISNYPRVGISIMENPKPFGISNAQHNLINEIRISILILAENTRLIDKIGYTIKNSFVKDAKTFYNFNYIRPDSSRPLVMSEDSSNMVLGLNMDFIAPWRIEQVNYT